MQTDLNMVDGNDSEQISKATPKSHFCHVFIKLDSCRSTLVRASNFEVCVCVCVYV